MPATSGASRAGQRINTARSESERRARQRALALACTAARHPKRTAAIVDRLTFAGQIIETGTTSYRLAHARRHKAQSMNAAGPARPGVKDD